ncbi:MAG: TOBE domain-containing protein, partial [Chloroflexi bacterium]|nr:TOBE domain-containing protein [Chloroflexota bacterium]
DGPRQRENITVGIRSSDIILASEEPRGTSARNRLPGTVTAVDPRPPGYEVALDCGVPLKAQVTGAAMSEMGIRPGQIIWAVFKASSCFLVQEEMPPPPAD